MSFCFCWVLTYGWWANLEPLRHLWRKHSKEGGKWKGHILVMGSYDNNNALKILLQRLEVPLAFCNVPQDAIGLPAEHVHFPYCFVLEENLEVKHLFIPDKVVPMLSEEYFKSIINHYYSDEL